MHKEACEGGLQLSRRRCGTGRLAFQLADRCSRIDAIDLSKRNVRVALSKLGRLQNGNVAFHHSDAIEFLGRNPARYDYAAVTYVIHEMSRNERLSLLSALSSEVEKIILVDYAVPEPGGIPGVFNRMVEFAAGADHYRNYRSFMEGAGLTGLVNEAGLIVVSRPKLSQANGANHGGVGDFDSI